MSLVLYLQLPVGLFYSCAIGLYTTHYQFLEALQEQVVLSLKVVGPPGLSHRHGCHDHWNCFGCHRGKRIRNTLKCYSRVNPEVEPFDVDSPKQSSLFQSPSVHIVRYCTIIMRYTHCTPRLLIATDRNQHSSNLSTAQPQRHTITTPAANCTMLPITSPPSFVSVTVHNFVPTPPFFHIYRRSTVITQLLIFIDVVSTVELYCNYSTSDFY